MCRSFPFPFTTIEYLLRQIPDLLVFVHCLPRNHPCDHRLSAPSRDSSEVSSIFALTDFLFAVVSSRLRRTFLDWVDALEEAKAAAEKERHEEALWAKINGWLADHRQVTYHRNLGNCDRSGCCLRTEGLVVAS